MQRRAFIAYAVTMAVAAPSVAGDADKMSAGTVQVTAAQISELLSGNTIKGTWNGSAYTQYYGESGLTLYIPDDGPPSRGKWRVSQNTDQYDSWWENTGWTPYTVVMTNDGYAWVNKGKLEPFEVLEGKQADF